MIGKTLGCLLFIQFFLAAGDVCGAKAFYGTITQIIDGDSLIIATAEKKIEVRLYGIDCPEHGQPYSDAAKQFSRKAVHGRKVLITPYYYDTYGRMVSLITCGGTLLNSDLVRAGLAWVYPRYCRKSFCTDWEENEQSAREEKKGLWHDPAAISPWRWKGMHHQP